jgi:hypothetical protein
VNTSEPRRQIDQVGINLVVDQAYIGDFETHFKDLAIFGELTGHITGRLEVTGRHRLFLQSCRSPADRSAVRRSRIRANESLSDRWRRALWKVNTVVSDRQDQSGLRHLVPGLPARRRECAAAERALGGSYVTPPALTRLQPDTADNYEVGIEGQWPTGCAIRRRSTTSNGTTSRKACSSRRWCCRPRSTSARRYSRGLELEVFREPHRAPERARWATPTT